MSDNYTTLTFQNSNDNTFEADSQKLVDYLVLKNLLIKNARDEENIYRPGLKFLNILENPEYYHHVNWNYAEILKGRQIFSEAEGAHFTLRCDGCHITFEGLDSPIDTLLDDFYKNTNDEFICPECGYKKEIRFCETKGFAAGFLGIQIWNWGSIKKEFIDELAQYMNSKILVIEGHL